MANKQLTDLPEIGRNLVDADEIMVGKTRSALTRVYTYILGKLQAASSWIAIGNIANGLLTRAKLADATGQSVIGRTATGTGAVGDIPANTNDRVLARTASAVLDFVQVTTAMLLDAIVTPAKLAPWPAASASRSTAQTITNSSVTTADLNTSDFTQGGSDAPTVDLTNNWIQVTRAGTYRITGRAGWTTSGVVTSGGGYSLILVVNAVQRAQISQPAIQNFTNILQITELMQLPAAAQVRLDLFQNTGNSQNTLTGNAVVELQVEYVGPT